MNEAKHTPLPANDPPLIYRVLWAGQLCDVIQETESEFLIRYRNASCQAQHWISKGANLYKAPGSVSAPDMAQELARLRADNETLRESLRCIVAALSQPVQTCEPTARTAAILLGDCTFARQEARTALASSSNHVCK